MEFPKYAKEVDFDRRIASDIYQIGIYVLQFKGGGIIFKNKGDIINYLKKCTVWHHGQNEEKHQYHKRWAIFKALLYGWNSLSIQTTHEIYHHVMYHHHTMINSKTGKSTMKPHLCFLYDDNI